MRNSNGEFYGSPDFPWERRGMDRQKMCLKHAERDGLRIFEIWESEVLKK